MATTFDRFEELETRIIRAVELVKSTRQELAASRSQVETLERELTELRRERDLVKNKVEALLKNLSELTEESVV